VVLAFAAVRPSATVSGPSRGEGRARFDPAVKLHAVLHDWPNVEARGPLLVPGALRWAAVDIENGKVQLADAGEPTPSASPRRPSPGAGARSSGGSAGR
jgi:hypothetical protein